MAALQGRKPATGTKWTAYVTCTGLLPLTMTIPAPYLSLHAASLASSRGRQGKPRPASHHSNAPSTLCTWSLSQYQHIIASSHNVVTTTTQSFIITAATSHHSVTVITPTRCLYPITTPPPPHRHHHYNTPSNGSLSSPCTQQVQGSSTISDYPCPQAGRVSAVLADSPACRHTELLGV